MEAMRESWTDARLDDFRAETARRFDGLERRMDARFDHVEERVNDLSSRFDALNRTLLQIGGGTIATLIAGFFGVVATQL
jgi:hypothetical protein